MIGCLARRGGNEKGDEQDDNYYLFHGKLLLKGELEKLKHDPTNAGGMLR
jgi:hypothetical protein